MEKNMSRVQPQALNNEELLNHIYMQNYNVPAEVVKDLCERFDDMQAIAVGLLDMGIPPSQLELPL
jgi:hypothetical protein